MTTAMKDLPTSLFHTTLDEVEALETTEGGGWRSATFRILIGPRTIPGARGCVYRAFFKKDGQHMKHIHHDSDEFGYVIQGHGAHGQGDDEWEVGPGSVYYIPKGVTHWMRNLSPVTPIEVVGCYFDAGDLAETGYEVIGPVTEADWKVMKSS